MCRPPPPLSSQHYCATTILWGDAKSREVKEKKCLTLIGDESKMFIDGGRYEARMFGVSNFRFVHTVTLTEASEDKIDVLGN